ncbi:uncharacterized protein LOC127008051 isoform X2 [Eriocheir sinensis]|uniref:uncharacterized protein LOC127008051 isoform X2 n=1 Tax=Eriocheir sinensis TaxID=95602 RepID=UPI0021C84EFD|nr:uncharacterized protein LOC127008051 isoform X2 [Eriocheir sinensis]
MITTCYVNQLNLNEVEELLPPNHHLQALNRSIRYGEQPEGKYFVFSLDTFWGKRKIGDTYRARITVHDVLENCSPEKRTYVDGLAFGTFCEAIEEPILGELGYKETWSKNSSLGDNLIWSKKSPSSITVWLVLHCTLVHPYMWGKEDRHPLMIRIDPKPPSRCEMWVMVSVSQHETIPATPIQKVAPTLAVSPVRAKPAPQPSRSSSSAGARETPAPASVKLRAPLPATAQAPATTRDLVGSHSPSKRKKKFELKSLVKAKDNLKINTVGVVVKVVKEGHLAKNGVVFDIFMVTAQEMTLPTSPQTHMNVKVFHNDGGRWPEGLKLQCGQVLMLQDLHCKKHMDTMEGIVYNTKMCCVVSNDEEELTWYENSNSRWTHENIVDAERKALRLFHWWKAVGENFNYVNMSFGSPSKQAAPHPTCTLAQTGGKGYFNLFCQVVKKTLYPSKCVLRVTDGTCTQYFFEEINYDPTKKVEDHNRVFSPPGSLEVDVLVFYGSNLRELADVQEKDFVELEGLDCMALPDKRRQLDLTLALGKIRLLRDDEPQRQTIMEALEQLRTQEAERAEEENDDVSLLDSEQEIPEDSFQEFIENQGYKRRPDHGKRSLGTTSTSGTFPRKPPSTPEQPLCDNPGKPHTSKQPPKDSSPQKSPSPSKRPLHPSSPLPQHLTFLQKTPSPPKQPYHPSSPQKTPSPPKQPYHPSSPQSQPRSPLPNCPLSSKTNLHPSSPPPQPCSPLLKSPSPKQPPHSSSPQPQQHSPLPKSPFPSKLPFHPSSPQPSTSRQPDEVAPRNPNLLSSSITYDLKEQLQYKMGETRNASSDRRLQHQDHGSNPSLATDATQQTLSFCTEVRSEAKESSLENFYQSGKVGEVYRVKAAIKGFRIQKNCNCDGENVCLHQWLWGLCTKCSRTFSSCCLSFLDTSKPLDSDHHFACPYCTEHNSGGGSQPLSYPRRTSVIMPFIKIRMVITDPSTGLQLSPWLCADHANLFFNVKPTFKWLTDKPEVQETVESLVLQKTPVDLGLKKMVWAGRVKTYIVNTVLFTTPSSFPPCIHSLSTTPQDSDSPISSHPDSPSDISPHPDSPCHISTP